MSLPAKLVIYQGPGAVQFAFPVNPVVGAWPVKVNLCIQTKFLYAIGEGPVLRP